MKKFFLNAFLSAWLLTLVSGSVMMGVWHYSDFSKEKSLSDLVFEKQKSWQIIHFLGGECQCSEYLVDYLVKRGPSKEFHEKIIVFDDKKDFYKPLIGAGFNVKSLEYEKVSRENKPEGIPLLVIANPGGKVKYEGGYAEQMLNPMTKIKDIEMANKYKLAAKENRREVASYPAYGCYMSKKYRKWLDPAGMKY